MDKNIICEGSAANGNDISLKTETSKKDEEGSKTLSICGKHNKVDPNVNCGLNAWTDKPQKNLIDYNSLEKDKTKENGDEEKCLISKANGLSTISNGDIYSAVINTSPPKHKKSKKCFLQLWNENGEEWPQRESNNFSSDFCINFKQCLDILKPPYFILAIIIVVMSIHKWGGDCTQHLLVYSPRERLQVWRLLSYALVHANIEHAALNVLLLAVSGVVLEREQSSLRVALVFWGGVLLGGLAASVLQPDLYLMGASGGVYALLTSHLSNVCLNWDVLSFRWYRIFAVFVLSASDAGAVAARHGEGVAGHPTGWAAHAAGALAGITIAFLCYKGTRRRKFYNIGATVFSALILIGVVATTIVLNILMDDPIQYRDREYQGILRGED